MEPANYISHVHEVMGGEHEAMVVDHFGSFGYKFMHQIRWLY